MIRVHNCKTGEDLHYWSAAMAEIVARRIAREFHCKVELYDQVGNPRGSVKG
jgi:hypothetical protein